MPYDHDNLGWIMGATGSKSKFIDGVHIHSVRKLA